MRHPEKQEEQTVPPEGLPMYPVEQRGQVDIVFVESVQVLQAMLQG